MTEPVAPAEALSVAVAVDSPLWTDAEGWASLVRATLAGAWAGLIDPLSGDWEVSVALVDDAAIRSLNAAWRGKDGATDVLSFPQWLDPRTARAAPQGQRHSLGDIVLAQETCTRRAAEAGLDARTHLQHLLIHGLLHLLGHDHLDDIDAARMEALETALCRHLALPDPYAGAAA